jgi:serum/glucocorticoid-regulated kinase 2
MLTGLPPFWAEEHNELRHMVLQAPLQFPGVHVVPHLAEDLLTRLLDRSSEVRLGAAGAFEIKAHPFFHGVDWTKLLQKEYEPTFKPSVARSHVSSNVPPY